MVICICSNINETKMRELIKRKNIRSVRDFRNLCSYDDCCGKCYKEVKVLIENEQNLHKKS